MNLQEYIHVIKEDNNTFWTLSSGEVKNLLEEAIERIEQLKREIRVEGE